MADDLLVSLLRESASAHARLLELTRDLDEGQLHWRPGITSPSIAFHLWHAGRWNDVDRTRLSGVPEIWMERGLARLWGIDESSIGEAAAGTGISDEASEELSLPTNEELRHYVAAAFQAFESAIVAAASNPSSDAVAVRETLIGGIVHDNRHLGMVEALRGILGLRGTATT
jgi:hypothetical protein